MTTTTTKTGRKPGRPRKVVDTPIKKLPNNPLAFEVLDLASKQRSVNKKVEVLKTYEHVSLKMLFLWNFDAAVESALPPGEVPYESYADQTSSSGTLSKKIDMQTRSMYETGSFSMGVTDQQGRTTIRRECTKFYHFVKGGNDGMKNLRRESMFINLLSGLHPLEAEIMCLVKEKNLEDKYKITRSIVEEAYPDIEWRDKA